MNAAAATILRNITPFDEIVLEIEGLYDEAKIWADGSPVENQAQCDALDVLDKKLLDASKRLDALRVNEKLPLDEQVQAIQDRYNPLIQPKRGKVDRARDALNPARAAWKKKLADEKAAAALKARIEAEEERQKAEDAIRASVGNLEAREKAEEQFDMAKEADAFANRQERRASTGLGMRTIHRAELSDLSAAIKHYWATRQGDFSALVTQLAAADVRAGKRTIPGFTIIEERKAL